MSIERRKRRLKELLERLKGGQDVAQRDLKNALTADEYEELQARWLEQKVFRSMEKPDEIKEYEARLKKAQFAYSKMDSYSQRRKRKSWVVKRLINNADSEIERTAEYLQEILSAGTSLIWFDREIVGNSAFPAADLILLPRVITSRSHVCEMKISVKFQSKRDVKILVVESALQTLETHDSPQNQEPNVIEVRKAKKKRDFSGIKV